jgi:hypothetical protein
MVSHPFRKEREMDGAREIRGGIDAVSQPKRRCVSLVDET